MSTSYRLPGDTSALVRAMTLSGLSTARATLRAYVSGNDYPHNLCINAGVAIELAVKACLLERSPALLLNARPNDIALASIAGLRSFGPTIDFPTVGLGEALKRMRWVWTAFPYLPAADAALQDNRNAAAHGGLVDEGAETPSLKIMVRLAQWIYDNPMAERYDGIPLELDDDGDTFAEPFGWWTGCVEVARRFVSDDQDDIGIRVAGKMESASIEFAQRYGRIPEEQARKLFDSLSAQQPDDGKNHRDYHPSMTVHHECPVCRNTGWLEVNATVIDYEYQLLDDGPGWQDDLVDLKRLGHPISFSCPVCTFSVGRSELAAVGLGDDIDLGWSQI